MDGAGAGEEGLLGGGPLGEGGEDVERPGLDGREAVEAVDGARRSPSSRTARTTTRSSSSRGVGAGAAPPVSTSTTLKPVSTALPVEQ